MKVATFRDGSRMNIDKDYEKETGKCAWIMYAHLAGPTKEFLEWIDEKYTASKRKPQPRVCPVHGATCEFAEQVIMCKRGTRECQHDKPPTGQRG